MKRARSEFIINSHVGVHPLALTRYEEVDDLDARRRIDRLTAGYADRTDYFVDRLARGVARIAASRYPDRVIVRMSNFKTNEYADLLGGRTFEPVEDNPMIGSRGASRYYSAHDRDGFALECRAMKKAREEIGLTNIRGRGAGPAGCRHRRGRSGHPSLDTPGRGVRPRPVADRVTPGTPALPPPGHDLTPRARRRAFTTRIASSFAMQLGSSTGTAACRHPHEPAAVRQRARAHR